MTANTSKASLPLPELKTGDTLISKKGNEYIVHKITGKHKRQILYDEPLYRLGTKTEWLLEELEKAGLTLKEATT